ncbi:MAG: DUF2125 domain-containing protein [Alphaproteobacteria bacterium]|nr:DUF2125 domain-containing protein [Alphaproteobacteria bacterium SS10]
MTDQSLPETAPDTAIKPKPSRVKRWLRRGGISLIAVIGVWSAIWFGYAKFIEQQAIQIISGGQQAAAGQGLGDPLAPTATPQRQFRYAAISMGGYPFGWHIHLSAPEVEDVQSGTRISADHAVIGFNLANFRQFEWQAIGGISARLPVPSNRPGIAVSHITATADQATGHFELSDTGARNPHFDVRQILITPGDREVEEPTGSVDVEPNGSITLDAPPGQEPTQRPAAPRHPLFNQIEGVALDRLTLDFIQPVWPPAQAGDPALTIDTAMLGLRPLITERADQPIVPNARLGQQVDEFGLRLTFTGPLPVGVYGYALGQWRDGGGALDLEKLSVLVGELHLEANGAATLDRALQPEGRIDVSLRGYDIVVDEMIASNQLPQNFAQMTQLLIQPFVQTTEDGERILRTQLGVSDRWLMLGPVQLVRLPPITWAGAR